MTLIAGVPCMAGPPRVKLLDGKCLKIGKCHNEDMVAVEKAVLAAGCRLAGFSRARQQHARTELFYQPGFEAEARRLAAGPLARWVAPDAVGPWQGGGAFDLLVVVVGPIPPPPEPVEAPLEERDGRVRWQGRLLGGRSVVGRLASAWKVKIAADEAEVRAKNIIFQTGMWSQPWLIFEQHGRGFVDKLWVVDGRTGELVEGLPDMRPDMKGDPRVLYSASPAPGGSRLVFTDPKTSPKTISIPLPVDIATGELVVEASGYLEPGRTLLFEHEVGGRKTLLAVSLAERALRWQKAVAEPWLTSRRRLVFHTPERIDFVDPATGDTLGTWAGGRIEQLVFAGETLVARTAEAVIGLSADTRQELWRRPGAASEVLGFDGLVVIRTGEDFVGLEPGSGRPVFARMGKPMEDSRWSPERKLFISYYDGQVHGLDPVSAEEIWASEHVLGEGPRGLVYEQHYVEGGDQPQPQGDGQGEEPAPAPTDFIRLRRPPDGPVLLSIPLQPFVLNTSQMMVIPPGKDKPMTVVVFKDGTLYGIAVEPAVGSGQAVLDDSLLGGDEQGP